MGNRKSPSHCRFRVRRRQDGQHSRGGNTGWRASGHHPASQPAARLHLALRLLRRPKPGPQWRSRRSAWRCAACPAPGRRSRCWNRRSAGCRPAGPVWEAMQAVARHCLPEALSLLGTGLGCSRAGARQEQLVERAEVMLHLAEEGDWEGQEAGHSGFGEHQLAGDGPDGPIGSAGRPPRKDNLYQWSQWAGGAQLEESGGCGANSNSSW